MIEEQVAKPDCECPLYKQKNCRNLFGWIDKDGGEQTGEEEGHERH